MIHRRLGFLKYLTPVVAVGAFVLGTAASAVESAPAKAPAAAMAEHAEVVALAPAGEDGMSWCQISGDGVNMRVGPNTINDPVTTLHGGVYIRAKVAQKDWLEMEWPRNVPAWVLKNAVQVSPADDKIGTIRANRARIMAVGNNKAPEVATLEHGARVAIIGEVGDWYKVQAPPAARAYISSQFVVVGVKPPADALASSAPSMVVAAPAIKAPAQQQDVAEAVPLAASPRRIKEIDADPAEVVVMQSEAAWPTLDAKARVETPKPAAASKKSDDSSAMFAPAPAAKVGGDERAAQAAAALRKAEQDEIARVASEKKQLAEADAKRKAQQDELARQAAEARRVELDGQAEIAAKRKLELETEIAKLAQERKKAEADEIARQVAEKKRLDEAEGQRIAAEARKKEELAEQSRLASERKKLEDAENERVALETRKRVDIETQTKAAAEKKKALEDELARLSEAKKKAEDEDRVRLEQTQKAAEKKKALETEIAGLAEAKKKEEQDALARAARQKKLTEEAELARQAFEAKLKAEKDELAKKETERKRLDLADAERAAADAKRRAELETTERDALTRKKALEAEIAGLQEAKRKFEMEALERIASDKKNTAEAETARAQLEAKKKAEIEELTRLAAERKRTADEEAARATSERKRADEAEAARLVAEKKRTEYQEAAKAAAALKQSEEDAARKAAAEKKRVEAEIAQVSAESQRKLEQEKLRLESERKVAAAAEQAKAAAAKAPPVTVARLPEPGFDGAAGALHGIALKTDRPIVLNDAELIGGREEPSEANYNVDYVPQHIRDLQKKYVVPLEAPKTSKVVAETIDVDVVATSAASIKPEPAPKTPVPAPINSIPTPGNSTPAPKAKEAAPSQAGESVELPPKTSAVKAEPPKPEPRIAGVVEINDSNFASEIENFKGVTLIDFSATWCGPCRRTAPIIEELAAEFSGKIKVAKVDVDQAPGLARRFGVNSLPCLMMFKDGKSTETRIGAQPKDYLKRWFQENVPAALPLLPGTGMNALPREQRTIASEVGQLERVSDMGIAGCKYSLKNNGSVLWYVIEPSDVDLSPLVGRVISLTGWRMGKTSSDVSVVQMRSASTFG